MQFYLSRSNLRGAVLLGTDSAVYMLFDLGEYGNMSHDRLQNHFDARVFIVGLVYGNLYGF